MPIHPDVAARFPLLDGLTSMREAYGTPAGLAQIRALRVVGAGTRHRPSSRSGTTSAPGPHGPVPVRIYEPPAGERTGRPCLVWAHGGGFLGGDLDMREADWTAREVCARAGAVVVSVDYRLAVDGVSYPVPHDDTVAAVAWVRDNAAALGIDARPHLGRRGERRRQPHRGRRPEAARPGRLAAAHPGVRLRGRPPGGAAAVAGAGGGAGRAPGAARAAGRGSGTTS